MKTALMVAEKPSLAQNLANILSNGKCSTNKGKFLPFIFSELIMLNIINYSGIFNYSVKF